MVKTAKVLRIKMLSTPHNTMGRKAEEGGNDKNITIKVIIYELRSFPFKQKSNQCHAIYQRFLMVGSTLPLYQFSSVTSPWQARGLI